MNGLGKVYMKLEVKPRFEGTVQGETAVFDLVLQNK
jgi:hypothetical protein